jgi:hypothetical protein
MSRELDVILHFLFLILSIATWLFNSQRKTSMYLKYIGVFLFTTFLFDAIAALIMFHQFGKEVNSNLFLYHILTPIQFSLIILIYHNVIKNSLYKSFLILLIPIFLLISIIFSFTIQPLSTYNSYSILIKHTIIIIIILIFFYELLSTTPYTEITRQPIFWISIALLFHSSFNILLEGVSNYLKTYSTSKNTIYTLYSISNYLLFILLSVSFLVNNSTIIENEPTSKL